MYHMKKAKGQFPLAPAILSLSLLPHRRKSQPIQAHMCVNANFHKVILSPQRIKKLENLEDFRVFCTLTLGYFPNAP